MAALDNSKHEAFCRAILEGRSGREAYAAAGYKAKPAAADTNASRLLKNAQVAARIGELKAEAALGSVMSAREVLEELSKLARTNAADVMAITVADDVVGAVQALPRELSAALHEVTVDTYIDGAGDGAREVKRVKFKLHDKRAALVDIGRHHGVFKDRVEHSGKDGGAIETRDVSGLSPNEIARRIAYALIQGAPAGSAVDDTGAAAAANAMADDKEAQ
jgi:phage terminase small subunit